MKGKLTALGAAFIAVVCIAAAAEVSRQEFDALAERVKTLENSATLRKIELKGIKKELKAAKVALPERSQEAKPEQQVEDKVPSSTAELEGRDLQAWKLAHEAAYGVFDRWANGCMRQVSAAGYAEGLTTTLCGEPTAQYMRKDKKGDYLFRFHFLCTLANGEVWKQSNQDIRVVDLGTELRARPLKSGRVRIR